MFILHKCDLNFFRPCVMPSHHEQVRPRIADMRELDGEQSWVDWPPAAKVVRAKPPSVGKANGAKQAAPEARDAAQEAEAPAASAPARAPFRPIMGEIRERDPSVESVRPVPEKPMSAFRRSRLERAGKAKTAVPQSPQPSADPMQDLSRDPGGGAPPEMISSVMDDISRANAAKVASMSYETRAEELRDAEAFFGKDTLAKLAARLEQSQIKSEDQASGWPALERRAVELDAPLAPPQPVPSAERDAHESFRQAYFPDEPEAVPPALEWTVPHNDAGTASVRFDFQGHVTTDAQRVWTEAPDATYLAGLHHHGSEQNVPGYTIDELLHLARSSVASQRTMAMQVLQRISQLYPMSAPPSSAHAILSSDAHSRRAHIVLSSCWLLHDRHKSVRIAAGQCLEAACHALRSVPTDPFALAAMPTCAAPEHDWLWQSSEREEAWTPYARAPSFHAPDATPIERIQRHWPQALLASHILDALEAWVHEAPMYAPSVASVVSMLVLHDPSCATAVHTHPRLVLALMQMGATQYAWPLSEPYPSVDAVVALLRMVQASRDTAASLVQQGAVDPLLRYVLILPRDMTGAASAPDVRAHEHALLYVTMRVLTALARYGLASTSMREVAQIVPRLAEWTQCVHSLPADDVAWHTAHAFFDLLAAWTQAAKYGAQHGDLGINGPMVQGWAPYANAFLQKRVQPCIFGAYGAALSHLATWAECAAHWSMPVESTVSQATCAVLVQAVMEQISEKKDVLASRDVRAILDTATFMALSAPVVSGAVRLCRALGTPAFEDACTALLSMPWSVLAAPMIRASGLAMAQLVQILTACASATTTTARIRLLLSLGPCDAAFAARLFEALVKSHDQRCWAILAPFFLDNIRTVPTPSMIEAQLFGEAHTPTLCMQPGASVPDLSDPQTGAPLWTSPACGLPLRPDWPLLALDDLLHSGEARALNAADALPRDWDFSEADIVRSSLSLAVHIAACGVVPSAFWWLGIYKVFLLEQASPATHEATGAATGRDLYTDSAIATSLRALMDVADQLALRDPSEPTLEEATDRIHGSSISFYQMYTDVVGLYDAVSMHNPLFARALLPPLAMAYPCDYRRLLWNDYAHTLQGITINVDDAPAVKGHRPDAYLSPRETDDVVLARYADALDRGNVTNEYQPFLYTIAKCHVSAAS